MANDQSDRAWMERALELALRGVGSVEPNPMVGCVLVRDGEKIGEGWHQKFGGPHAEIEAIRSCSHDVLRATAYVTLEPCSHFGKTPPCASALVTAGVSKVFVAHLDPNPKVAGKGIETLRAAGIEVNVGLLQNEAADVLSPYLKRVHTGKPWLIAKWAMTLDGKIATDSGDSQWISNEESRAIVHQIRGRVDAIVVGARTAELDNPLLTARPTGPRSATRIVLDSNARLSSNSQLCQTAGQHATMIVCGPTAAKQGIERLRQCGCEVWQHQLHDRNLRLQALLSELGQRGMTNVLVEGGGGLLGALNDLNEIDEVHVFLGPKLLGGVNSLGPIGGDGQPWMKNAHLLDIRDVTRLQDDVYIMGRIRREPKTDQE